MTEAEGVAAGMGDEVDLIVLAGSDSMALERLYQTYRPPIFRYLRTRCDSEDDAADLTSDTFERAFRGLGTYRPEGSPISWLLRIARNAAVDAARRRRSTVPLGDVPSERHPLDERSPEASFLAAERVAELRNLVRRLPGPQREAIALRYASGLTAREIATVIGKSEAATQKLLTRALVALKEAYDVEP